MMKRTHKTPALAKLAMLLLFAIAAVAILDTTSISAQELGRTITSPFGIARQTSASESGTDGDTFVDPETGEVGHIIRNPFGVANPNDVDTGIDIPDSGEEEVGGIITSPFGVPASDDIDTGVDVFDEDEEYLISLPDDEESDVEESEDADEVDDETSDDAKELEEELAEATTEKYVPVKDNPIPNREWDDFNFTLRAESQGRVVEVTTDYSPESDQIPVLYVHSGKSFKISVIPTDEASFSPNCPSWDIYAYITNSLEPGLDSINVPDGTKSKTFYTSSIAGYGAYYIKISNFEPLVHRSIKIVIITFSMTVDNPIRPPGGQTYQTLLATNISDESSGDSPYGRKPDYANWAERENETSFRKMTMRVDLGNECPENYRIKLIYDGLPSLIEPDYRPQIIEKNGINILKDIFYQSTNDVYWDYTPLRNNNANNYLRIWTSSIKLYESDGWTSLSPINATSSRFFFNYGTLVGNYLAPSASNSYGYHMSVLFPENSGIYGEKTLYLEGVNSSSRTHYINATLYHYNNSTEEYEELFTQKVGIKLVEGKVFLNTNNDPNYIIDDNDHKIKDQKNGFQCWYYDNTSSTDESSTYGIENLFPFEVKALSSLPNGMKYVVKIDGEQNPGVVLLNPAGSGNRLTYIRNNVDDLRSVIGSANSKIEITRPDVQNEIGCLFGIYKNDVETIESHISLYLCSENATTMEDAILLDNARITIRPIDKYFELWSSRENDPSFIFYDYPIDHSTAPLLVYNDAIPESGFADATVRNYEKNVLIFLHGFNVDETQAQTFHRYVYRKLYWTGYRDNYIGWSWTGNDFGNGIEPFVGQLSFSDLSDSDKSEWFDSNTFHALQSSYALCKFIEINLSGFQPEINLAAHSLGNLVMWDALRIHACHPFVSQPKQISTVVSVEGAVWSEAFRDYDYLIYDDEIIGCNITYSPNELERHSWSHWFRQDPHNTLYHVNMFVNSRNTDDYALVGMKIWNTFCSNDYQHFNRDNLTHYRTSGRYSLPEFAALLKKGHRYPGAGYIYGNLTNPIGLTDLDPSTNPDFDFHLLTNELGGTISNLRNVYSPNYNWDSMHHNDMNCRFDQIYPWYYKVFRLDSLIIHP